MLPEEKPIQVPISIDACRWPFRAERIECGECGDALPVKRFTALSELAETLIEHTSCCRVFS